MNVKKGVELVALVLDNGLYSNSFTGLLIQNLNSRKASILKSTIIQRRVSILYTSNKLSLI